MSAIYEAFIMYGPCIHIVAYDVHTHVVELMCQMCVWKLCEIVLKRLFDSLKSVSATPSVCSLRFIFKINSTL